MDQFKLVLRGRLASYLPTPCWSSIRLRVSEMIRLFCLILILICYRLGVKVNALFFCGFAIASFLGVALNNTVVPLLGWSAIYIILGMFTVISFVLLMFFDTTRTVFIPFDNERPLYRNKEDNRVYQMK